MSLASSLFLTLGLLAAFFLLTASAAAAKSSKSAKSAKTSTLPTITEASSIAVDSVLEDYSSLPPVALAGDLTYVPNLSISSTNKTVPMTNSYYIGYYCSYDGIVAKGGRFLYCLTSTNDFSVFDYKTGVEHYILSAGYLTSQVKMLYSTYFDADNDIMYLATEYTINYLKLSDSAQDYFTCPDWSLDNAHILVGGTAGSKAIDGRATSARLMRPTALALDSTNKIMYFMDITAFKTYTVTLRKYDMNTGIVSTIISDFSTQFGWSISFYSTLASLKLRSNVAGTTLYTSNGYGLYSIDVASQAVTLVAGTTSSTASTSAATGTWSNTRFQYSIVSMASDRFDNLYVVTPYNTYRFNSDGTSEIYPDRFLPDFDGAIMYKTALKYLKVGWRNVPVQMVWPAVCDSGYTLYQGVCYDDSASTVAPTSKPTKAPTASPTYKATNAPTAKATSAPTASPTFKATNAPTVKATSAPTAASTNAPTAKTTSTPTALPTEAPTRLPTRLPTEGPTEAPTREPTNEPTIAPSSAPISDSTNAPTKSPSHTHKPTKHSKTDKPTSKPSRSPSWTHKPTKSPSWTHKPTHHSKAPSHTTA